MVAVILVTVGVLGSLGANRNIEITEQKAKTVDLLQRLAVEKANDLSTVTDPSTYGSSGDFSDRGYPNATWSVDVEPTSITNLDEVTVTATMGADSETIATELYVQTQSSTAATTAGGTP